MTLLRPKPPNLPRHRSALIPVDVDLIVFAHIESSREQGKGILVALSVSNFLHAFRATNVLFGEVV